MLFINKHYPALIMTFTGLISWEAFVRITNKPVWILPAPTKVLEALINEREIILGHSLVTLYEAVLGYMLAIFVAAILAIIIDNNSFFKKGFYPILVTSQSIPIIAIAPLLLMWLGYGILPKIVVVALVSFFPIVVSAIDGLNSADKELISLLHTMDANKWQIFKKVRLPSALPSIFSGLRIAATYSVMAAVIGEWLGASKGLGIYMKNSSHSFLTAQVFAAIIVIVASSILFYWILLVMEASLIPWNKKKFD